MGFDIYIRFKITRPRAGWHRVRLTGNRHQGPDWALPVAHRWARADRWSRWLDLSHWPLHGRIERAGGIAEWIALSLEIRGRAPKRAGECELEIELTDREGLRAGVSLASFRETGDRGRIYFVLPLPLRAHAAEVETAHQMVARHEAWARAHSVRGPRRFCISTAVWPFHDHGLATRTARLLSMLGFNQLAGLPPGLAADEDSDRALADRPSIGVFAHFFRLTEPGHLSADPSILTRQWRRFAKRWNQDSPGVPPSHIKACEEARRFPLERISRRRLSRWYREWARDPSARYPFEKLHPRWTPRFRSLRVAARLLHRYTRHRGFVVRAELPALSPAALDLSTRRELRRASAFGQAWSAARLAQSRALAKQHFASTLLEVLPSNHGLLGAWQGPHLGMGFTLLDYFALARAKSADIVTAEDWLGLNRMYGPHSTWTGAQTLEYLCAILRSAFTGTDTRLHAMVTVSDARYLQLKAFAGIAQGAQGLTYWAYGPTFLSTENYWSDHRDHYVGVAQVNRILARIEDRLVGAQLFRDPVAILYSVSHDLWHADRPQFATEKRLLWHALRHSGFQPDFISEEAIAAGALAAYRVLYITDVCLMRDAGAKIDAWVRAGGTVYLSAAAATRDEHFEPASPGFAAAAWGEGAASRVELEPGKYAYNERTDLGQAPMLDRVYLGDEACQSPPEAGLDAVGAISHFGDDAPSHHSDRGLTAHFTDDRLALRVSEYGHGRCVAIAFMPMLAYGRGARFVARELRERWPSEPRRLAMLAAEQAKLQPRVRLGVPVVAASLLEQSDGSAVLVLINYTYEPIANLVIEIASPSRQWRSVASTEPGALSFELGSASLRIEMRLEWTDVLTIDI